MAQACMVLQVQLARRMAAWSGTDATADPVSACTDAGIPVDTARLWLRAARFAQAHPALHTRWLTGQITARQVGIVVAGTRRLDPATADGVIAALAPALPGLTPADTAVAVEGAVDTASPQDTRQRERDDYARRRLNFTGIGGGIDLHGYLPPMEAGALQAAIEALVDDLRVEGDGLTMGQRRADALSALVAKAAAHGLPTGGGLPAAITLTISSDEANRIAAQNLDGPIIRPYGSGTANHSTAPIGDADTRFALCCAPITPIHHHGPISGTIGVPVHPLQVGRTVRLATAAQRKALALRDKGCAIPGCQIRTGYTQPHHVQPWNLGGATDLQNLISLCWAHHRQTEHGIWTIQPAPRGSPAPFIVTRNRR